MITNTQKRASEGSEKGKKTASKGRGKKKKGNDGRQGEAKEPKTKGNQREDMRRKVKKINKKKEK
jgi:hypothetical protein